MGRAEDIFNKICSEGEAAVDELILTRQAEELFLDFKRSADSTGSKLHDVDRKNLAKAISGFGNSEGGVIIWGIDCSRADDHADVAHAKYPIQNVKRFVSWLEGAISGCTIPPHTTVQNRAIITNQDYGFVITLIPKSNHAPHQVALHGKYQHNYYIRAGSNFERTPHGVLAGMFGRRPQPHVFHNYIVGHAELINGKIRFDVGLMIRNEGPGIARDLFMNLLMKSVPGINCDTSIAPTAHDSWTYQQSFGMHFSTISKDGVRVPPESYVQPCVITLEIAPPFTTKLEIDGICGCDQSPSYKFRFVNDSVTIEKLFNDYIDKSEKGLLAEEDKQKIISDILNIE